MDGVVECTAELGRQVARWRRRRGGAQGEGGGSEEGSTQSVGHHQAEHKENKVIMLKVQVEGGGGVVSNWLQKAKKVICLCCSLFLICEKQSYQDTQQADSVIISVRKKQM